MHIKNLYQMKRPVMSFEVFPPNDNSPIETVTEPLEKISSLNPSFVSVTYGAGGSGNNSKTIEIASHLKNNLNTESLAHLTCVGAKKADIKSILDKMASENIENILALRGDIEYGNLNSGDFPHASDLIKFIKDYGKFSVGAACYPEGHVECDDLCDNYRHLLKKQASGADFFISQLFFENGKFFRFLEMAQSKGVTAPIIAGLMPILSKKQVEKMIFKCGVSLPAPIVKILYKYEHNPLDLQKAGMEYTFNQIEDLIKNGQCFVHIYSMNKPEVAAECKNFFDNIKIV